MNLQRELRNDLRQHIPQSVSSEHTCSCGASNHARIFLFRLNGEPATAIVPEARALNTAKLAEALPGTRVESLSVAELGSIFPETELGHMGPFDNPFGDSVYLEQSLLQCDDLVFCPKMFGGKTRECFRVPTCELCQVIHPIALRLPLPVKPPSEHKE